MQSWKFFLLHDGRTLSFVWEETRRAPHPMTSHSQAWSCREYMSHRTFERSDGHRFAVMAFTCERRPRATLPLWGVYRVETEARQSVFRDGYYTLLEGGMTRQQALLRLPEIVVDDLGHQHEYWTTQESLLAYAQGYCEWVTAHCKRCEHRILNKEVYKGVYWGQIEVQPLC